MDVLGLALAWRLGKRQDFQIFGKAIQLAQGVPKHSPVVMWLVAVCRVTNCFRFAVGRSLGFCCFLVAIVIFIIIIRRAGQRCQAMCQLVKQQQQKGVDRYQLSRLESAGQMNAPDVHGCFRFTVLLLARARVRNFRESEILMLLPIPIVICFAVHLTIH